MRWVTLHTLNVSLNFCPLPTPFYLRRGTSTQIYKSILSFLLLLGTKGFSSSVEDRQALEHGLLRPLISELRSEVTSEATGSLRGHFQRNSYSSGTISQF